MRDAKLIAALAALCITAVPAWAVSYEANAPGVNGFTTVDKITWRDSKGLDRELYFARSYPNPVVEGIIGYVTRLTWQPAPGAPRIIAEEEPQGINSSNAQGWGTTVMHMHYLQYGGVHPVFGSGGAATTNKRDGFGFVMSPLFLGPHHLIFRVTYRQYTTLIRSGTGADDRKFVYVTVDWFISDGLDHVVYAVTIDASRGYLTDSVAFLNNSLAPYSWLSPAPWKGTYDWAGGSGAPDGQSWGDFKRFVTNDMARWTYGGSNPVPFVWEWVGPSGGRGDAEAAFVQTETYAQKRAGEGFAQGNDATGSHMPVYPDLGGQEACYQLNFFDSYQSKRLTWATRFGMLYGGSGATPGYINYSLAMYMGRYSEGGAPALLNETERLHAGQVNVSAVAGQLVSTGPEGSGNPTPHTYSPRGYNQVYRTWEVRSSGNAASLSFDLGTGNYRRPVFVVHNYLNDDPGSVQIRLNGALLPSSGFVASIDAAANKLYVTLLSTLSGNNLIQFQNTQATTGPAASAIISPATVTVAVGGTVNFSAQVRDAQGNVIGSEPVTWSATGGSGSISGGLFTAGCTPGTFTAAITARTANGTTGTATVVLQQGEPTRVVISPSNGMVPSRGTQQYTAVVRDGCNNALSGQTLTWSAPAAVGTIDSNGRFTAQCTRASYPAGISATTGSVTGTAGVSVIAGPVLTIDVTPLSVSVTAGATQQFVARANDLCSNEVTAMMAWSTTSPGATVSSAGLFTAGTMADPNEYTVSASFGGITGRAFVTVLPGAVSALTVTPARVTLAPGASVTFTASGRDANGNTVVMSPHWAVVAGGGSITGDGVFTAGAASGTFTDTVRARLASVNTFATVTVAVGPVDAGVVDAGVQPDAGVPTDAGLEVDGGVVEVDAGMAELDAGFAVDAGEEKPRPIVIDSGETTLPAAGGCTCNSSGALSMVALALLALRRRGRGAGRG